MIVRLSPLTCLQLDVCPSVSRFVFFALIVSECVNVLLLVFVGVQKLCDCLFFLLSVAAVLICVIFLLLFYTKLFCE